MAKFAAILISVLLSSCASMPLGTMFEFRSYGKDDFIAIQPRELRAKILVDEPVRANVDSAEIVLELTTKKGMRQFKFPLRILSEQRISPVVRYFLSSAGKTEYTLKLSDEAVNNFIATQKIIQEEQSGSFSFSVNTDFEKFPSEINQIGFSILLMLSERKGFVTLFDDVKLQVKQEG